MADKKQSLLMQAVDDMLINEQITVNQKYLNDLQVELKKLNEKPSGLFGCFKRSKIAKLSKQIEFSEKHISTLKSRKEALEVKRLERKVAIRSTRDDFLNFLKNRA